MLLNYSNNMSLFKNFKYEILHLWWTRSGEVGSLEMGCWPMRGGGGSWPPPPLTPRRSATGQLPAFVLLHTHGSYNGAQTRDLQVTVDESAARETSPDELRHRPCSWYRDATWPRRFEQARLCWSSPTDRDVHPRSLQRIVALAHSWYCTTWCFIDLY